jgi:hypothetical protein
MERNYNVVSVNNSLNFTNNFRSRMDISNYDSFKINNSVTVPALDTYIDASVARTAAAKRDERLRLGTFPGQINCCAKPVCHLSSYAVFFSGNIVPCDGVTSPVVTGLVSAPAGSTFFEVVRVGGYNYALLDTSYLTDLPVGCYFKSGDLIKIAMSVVPAIRCRIGVSCYAVDQLPILPVSYIDKCTNSFGYFCGGMFFLGQNDQVRQNITSIFKTEKYGELCSDNIMPFEVFIDLPYSQAHICVKDCNRNGGFTGVVCDHARSPVTFVTVVASKHYGILVADDSFRCVVCGKATSSVGQPILLNKLCQDLVGDVSPTKVTSKILPIDLVYSSRFSSFVKTRFYDPGKLSLLFRGRDVRICFDFHDNADLVFALKAAGVKIVTELGSGPIFPIDVYVVFNKVQRDYLYGQMNAAPRERYLQTIFICIRKRSDLALMSVFDQSFCKYRSSKELLEDHDEYKTDKNLNCVGFGLVASYYHYVSPSSTALELGCSLDDKIWAYVCRSRGEFVHQLAIINAFANVAAKSTVKKALNRMVLAGRVDYKNDHNGSYYAAEAKFSEIRDKIFI